jgi:hypothetical protein
MSRLATAALACAVAGPLTAGITAVPAIMSGHMARRRVRRTGERGVAGATAAVVPGWLTVLIAAVTAGSLPNPPASGPGEEHPALPPLTCLTSRPAHQQVTRHMS